MRILVSVALVAAMAGSAAAQSADDFSSGLDAWGNIEAYLGDGTSWETLVEEQGKRGKDCDAYVKKIQKKLAADLDLRGYFQWSKDATQLPDGGWSLKVKLLGQVCDHYRQRLDQLQLGSIWESSQSAERHVNEGLTDQEKQDIRAGGDEARKNAALCTTLVERLAKEGAGDDFVIKSRYEQSTFGVVKTRCDLFTKEADLLDAVWKEASKEFEKPFKDAGITGDRLSWFTYYGPGIEVWYLKGCKGETSLKKIKKAKLLFQWLEGNDGITIRRFQWKGDKLVKMTEKVYLTEKAAYKGCK